jgi:hypothetical protein
MSNLEAELKKFLASKKAGSRIKDDNGKSLNQIVKEEGKRFYQILQKHINAYYDSYYPTVYQRTGAMGDSLQIETSVSDMSISVYFNDRAWHMPTSGKSPYLRFVPTLMDVGWEWKNAPRPIYRFTWWDGAEFIKAAIAEFNQRNPYNLTIRVESAFYPEYYRNL